MKPVTQSNNQRDFRIVAYAGDNKILIAMSLNDGAVNDRDKSLAGFAIWRTSNGKTDVLQNRITFDAQPANLKAPKWTPSDKAPFQKFRWVDVPPDGFHSALTYRVQALYFVGQTKELRPGPEDHVTITPAEVLHTCFRPAFTRGYIASQAYADKFHNAPIRPNGPKTPDFNTAPYQEQYKWLGADARQALFDFIAECKKDTSAHVDVFAYDLDEPDVIKAICDLGHDRPGRVRAVLDDADLHSKPNKKTGVLPPEIKAAKMIKSALGENYVKQGHFARYQHNKVFIKRGADGKGQRVIFGSMNFSVRGIYVQANNVIVVDDPFTAGKFADAFDVAFESGVKAGPFRESEVAQGYMAASEKETPELPKFSFALSPHQDPMTSLEPMVERMRAAKSSVLFAVMAPKGQGPVLATLREIAAKPTVFSYGTVETDKGLAVQSPDGAMGDITSYASLRHNVPAPFTQEFADAKGGIHIHDKFVVVDFNADNPTVFTGSSNLAAGGENQNGDSLAMIEDAAIANMYAIEAVALFDHYHFRKKVQESKAAAQPLTLWYPDKRGMPLPWWKEYYDRTKIQMRDRYLFAGLPLPADMPSTKDVDWAAVDSAAEQRAGKKTARKKAKAPAEAKTRSKAKAKAKPARRAAGKKKPKAKTKKSAGRRGRR